jgi:predicted ABC-type ATPase
MKAENPTVYIIGGANGVGKTTSFYDLFPIECPFINADEISRKLKESTNNDRNIQEIANREAVHQMNIYLSEKKTFGFESNLADIDTWKFIERIQIFGYQVHIIYYGLDDVNICIQRVQQRVKEGGHDVRQDIIKQRYEQSLALLKHYLALPNTLVLKDSSFIPKECAVLQKGVIVKLIDELPHWVENCITPNIPKQQTSASDQSIDDIRSKYKKGNEL